MRQIKPKPLRKESGNIGSEVVFQAKYPDRAWVIVVEGVTDKQVFEKLVCKQTMVLAGEAERGGKGSVLKALKIANAAECKNVLGIVDSDFENASIFCDKLKHLQNEPHNLFKTDTHDLETMIISVTKLRAFEEALQKCFGDSYWEACYKKNDCKCHKQVRVLIREMITILLPLGYALWLSERNNWHISFQEINVFDYVDEHGVNLDKLVDHLCYDRSISIKIHMRKELEQALLVHNEQDTWLIGCGHHLSKIVAMWFGGNQNVTYLFEKVLRQSFSIKDFRNTGLYKRIVEWQRVRSSDAMFA